MWVNRKGRYPYVSRETWVTRAWLLIRKVDRQRGVSSYSDRRVAVELLALAPTGRHGVPKHLVSYLQEVLCGSAEEVPYRPAGDAAEEGMGS